MRRHLNIKIYGRVQGVFFRAAAADLAPSLGVTGFARNEPDGTVYIEAEAEVEKLHDFIEWCHRGPEGAVVWKVEVAEGPLKNFSDFKIS